MFGFLRRNKEKKLQDEIDFNARILEIAYDMGEILGNLIRKDWGEDVRVVDVNINTSSKNQHVIVKFAKKPSDFTLKRIDTKFENIFEIQWEEE